ncbi:MAG: sigma-70 family RNA polymerase sigma factor [bacterium]
MSATTDRSNLEREELVKIIKKILEDLPEKYKNVFELKYFEGMSPKEMSVQLNMPVKQVYEFSNYGVALVKKKCEEKGIFQDFFD